MEKLNVRLLGAFEAHFGEEIAVFSSDKLRALLAYLLLEDRPHRRETLSGLLWADADPEKANNNLRVTLSRLRHSLQPFLAQLPEDIFLEVTRTTIEIHRGPNCTVDALRFEALLNAAEAHPHEALDRCSVCARRLEEAASLYRGDFLAGLNLPDSPPFGEWQIREQERWHQRALNALDALVKHKMAVAAWDEAQRYAEHQIELEPWREETYRRLMQIRLQAGDPRGAVTFFQRCRKALADELGAVPTAETVALYKQITAQAEQARQQPTPQREPTPVHNLPSQALPFFGREDDLPRLSALLIDPAYRLITLTGIGGAGKTRLALAAAQRVLNGFPDGVWFVPLAAISGDAISAEADLLQAIAAAVGYTFGGTRSEREQVLGHLAEKRMLLLLDNFEQLTDIADVVLDMLDAAQRLTILVTSRQRLLFHEEYTWLVDSLELPPPDAADVSDYSSVQLFVARAAQHSGFRLTAENSPAVARVCRLVDGIPLAIELAASWAFELAPEQIAAAISANIDFLQANMRDRPERHRSIRAVFDGSWAQLQPSERAALARLALFRGSFTRDAAQAVATVAERDLRSLSLKSLVVRREGDRYELHELLSEYAGEKLRSPEAAILDEAGRTALLRTHSRYYLGELGTRRDALDSSKAGEALAALLLDGGNLRSSWQWAVENHDFETLLKAAAPFAHYLWVQGLYREGTRLFGEAIQHAEQAHGDHNGRRLALAALLGEESAFLTALGQLDEGLMSANRSVSMLEAGDPAALLVRARQNLAGALRRMGSFAEAMATYVDAAALARQENMLLPLAGVLADLGLVSADQGYFGPAASYLGEALSIYRRADNLRGQSTAFNGLGMLAQRQSNYSAAHSYFAQTLQVAERIDHLEGIGSASANLGLIFEGLGQYNRALDYLRRSLDISRQLGDRWGESVALGAMGTIYIHYGDLEQARAQFSSTLELAQAMNDRQGQTWAYQHLAWVARLGGDYNGALRSAKEALRIARAIKDRGNTGFALLQLGYASLDRGDAGAAIDLFAEAAALRREMEQPGPLTEALSGVAAAHLAAGDTALAREEIRALMADLSDERLAGSTEPLRSYVTCYEVLLAAGEDDAARDIIDRAWRVLSEQVSHIDRPDIRRAFLNDVPLHARVVQLTQGGKRAGR